MHASAWFGLACQPCMGSPLIEHDCAEERHKLC